MKYVFWLTALLLAQIASAQPSTNRTALIIGVAQYGYPGPSALDGVNIDMVSAAKIANAMGIPDRNIKYLKNSDATKENVLKALIDLSNSTTEGSRSFVYFSGHGTRQQVGENCVEGLLTYEGSTITNQEFAKATQKLVKSADKVVTMIDACHAEGVAPPKGQTRSLVASQFVPRYFANTDKSSKSCSDVANMRSFKPRALLPEVTRLGGIQENFVQITSARPDEQSLELPGSGGLATTAIRDCLLGEAKDTNRSGAVTMAEIEQCAQSVINNALKGDKTYTPHHVTVSGNRNLIPVQRPPTVVAAVTPEPLKPVVVASTPPVVATPAPPVVVTPEPVKPPVKPEPIKVVPAEPILASLATLKDIEQQRNPKRVVDVKVSKPVMKIGADSLDLSIKSSHDGYIYMILLGSDAKSFYVLYPNGLDKNNAIKAGQTVRIPKPDWEVKAAGPVGTNNLLVMVSDSPRKLNTLTMAEPTAAEPFTYALNDIGGRSALINFLTSSGTDGKSESFGAKLVAIKEVK
jgi:hypothetical protein